MISIDLESIENAQVLINLLDIALRSKGTEAANAVLFFNHKIKAAMDANQPIKKMEVVEDVKEKIIEQECTTEDKK